MIFPSEAAYSASRGQRRVSCLPVPLVFASNIIAHRVPTFPLLVEFHRILPTRALVLSATKEDPEKRLTQATTAPHQQTYRFWQQGDRLN